MEQVIDVQALARRGAALYIAALDAEFPGVIREAQQLRVNQRMAHARANKRQFRRVRRKVAKALDKAGQ